MANVLRKEKRGTDREWWLEQDGGDINLCCSHSTRGKQIVLYISYDGRCVLQEDLIDDELLPILNIKNGEIVTL